MTRTTINLVLQKITPYLFYGFVFLLPWQTIYILREVFYGEEKWQYGTVGIYISDILLVLWIICGIYLYHNNIKNYIVSNGKLILSILSIILWAFISTIWTNNSFISIYFSLILFFAFVVFVLIQCTPLSLRTIANVFISSVFIQSIIGFFQFTTQQTISQKFLGLQYYDVFSGGNSVITTVSGRWLRNYGAMPHPNMFGALIVFTMLIVIVLYITQNKTNLWQKFLYLISIGLFTVNLLFTFSRNSWIALIIGILFLTIFLHKSHTFHIKQLFIPMLLIIGTVLATVTIVPSLFFTRINHDSLPSHNSFGDRKIYVQHAITEISAHPLIGTGLGNYTNTVFNTQNHAQPIWFYQPVHNIYLLITAELGIVGLILFGVFFTIFFTKIYKSKNNLSLLQKTFVTIIILALIMSVFDHWVWTSHFGLLLFFVFCGLTLIQKNDVVNDVAS